MIGALTRFRSDKGRLCKEMSLDADGKLVKKADAQLYRGTFKVETFTTVYELRALLITTTTSEAVSNSLPVNAREGRVVSKKLLADMDHASQQRNDKE